MQIHINIITNLNWSSDQQRHHYELMLHTRSEWKVIDTCTCYTSGVSPKEFILSILNPDLIFLTSLLKSLCFPSKFLHCIPSAGWRIISFFLRHVITINIFDYGKIPCYPIWRPFIFFILSPLQNTSVATQGLTLTTDILWSISTMALPWCHLTFCHCCGPQ
jgi:hypothetical protein